MSQAGQRGGAQSVWLPLIEASLKIAAELAAIAILGKSQVL